MFYAIMLYAFDNKSIPLYQFYMVNNSMYKTDNLTELDKTIRELMHKYPSDNIIPVQLLNTTISVVSDDTLSGTGGTSGSGSSGSGASTIDLTSADIIELYDKAKNSVYGG